MRHLITSLVLLAVFIPAIAHAKRKAPPKVQPLIYEGVRYTAPNDDGRRGYVQAWDATTNKMLWEVTVFRNIIIPLLEEDVQHVYIKSMSIQDGKLFLVAEDDRAYSVGLKTRAVKRSKRAPPEKTQANESLQWTARLPFIRMRHQRPTSDENSLFFLRLGYSLWS
jgi:hypothetical protein